MAHAARPHHRRPREQELADRRAAFDEATAAAEARGPDADVVDLIDCALALQTAEAVAVAVAERPERA